MTSEIALELTRLAVGVGATLGLVIVGLISILYRNHVKRIEHISENLEKLTDSITHELKELHERITEHLERHHTNHE